MGAVETNSLGARCLQVYSDPRWPALTGIGNVLTAMKSRAPDHLRVIDLDVGGSVGSPLSPLALSSALAREGVRDGVFWSAGFVPPLRSRVPAVVTVHDLTHLHFYTALHAAYYGAVFRPLYRRCHEIVCVSEYTRKEFLAWSGMPADRVSVVYNGVSPAYTTEAVRCGTSFEYVLYPGNHRGYKNLDRLLKAFAASSLPRAGIRLALTGNENPALVEKARQLGVSDALHFFGRVPDAELPGVYRGALGVAFVSLYEGFGLPIVEAMACGVPVLTSTVSAMPEVAGGAALLVDPYAEDEIARGLERMAADQALRADLIGKGLERVRRFDWDRSAVELWDIVERAAHQ